MDPPPAVDSRRRSTGRGGKPRGGKQLGLKRSSTPAPSSRTGSPPVPPTPPPPISASVAPDPTPAAANLSHSAPTSTMLPRPPQGAGWGAIPPNFPCLHGNQQGPNSWIYPPGGFVHMMEQPHYPSQPLVGQNMAFNPISPPPASAYRTPSPQATNKTVHNVIDDDNNDANKTVFVKRYWTHEEEERLASSWLEASKDPIHGNDKRG